MDSESQEHSRVLRMVLRRPEAVAEVEDLAATPNADFDSLFPKAYYAHQLRLAGHHWSAIATKLHYKSAQTAEWSVYKWLRKNVEAKDKHFPQTREMIRAESIAMELERLDALQAAYWQEAIDGDLASANFCLKVIQQRTSLVQPSAGPVAQVTHNTLVVSGDESQYVASLLRARDALAAGPAPVDDEPVVVESS